MSEPSGLTLTAARADLEALRADRKRLLQQCAQLDSEIRALMRTDSIDASRARTEMRAQLARQRSEIELADESIAAREKFIREIEGEIGGLALRKRQLEVSVGNGFVDLIVEQARV